MILILREQATHLQLGRLNPSPETKFVSTLRGHLKFEYLLLAAAQSMCVHAVSFCRVLARRSCASFSFVLAIAI